MNCSSCDAELAPQATMCGTCGRLVEDPLVGTTINGRYRILAKLAVGGFGAIYRAVQVNNNRKVAIKVMHRELSEDEQLVARFRREAVALCSLRDAHSVTTYEFDETPDGRLFIVMELLEGRNLLELFRASGPLPWRRVLTIARAVCSALAEAHGMGIIHRDLKPANIFLEMRHGAGEFVKVLDFGIAKIMHGSDIDDGLEELTVTGQAVGTLEYMAPEQLIGGKCDNRTDIYTLGIVVYELIVGRRPFAAVGVMDLLAAQQAERAPKPSLYVPLPGAVNDILLRCLERDAAARYADVIKLGTAIDEVLAKSDMELLATRTSTARGMPAPVKVSSSGSSGSLRPIPGTPPAGVPYTAATPPAGVPHTAATPPAGVPQLPAKPPTGVPYNSARPPAGMPYTATPPAGVPYTTATPPAGMPYIPATPPAGMAYVPATPPAGMEAPPYLIPGDPAADAYPTLPDTPVYTGGLGVQPPYGGPGPYPLAHEASGAAHMPHPHEASGAAHMPHPHEASGLARMPHPHEASGLARMPHPHEASGLARMAPDPRPRPRPRSSPLRITLIMIALAAIGVGVGMLISKLGF